MSDPEDIEVLAAAEHESWSGWTKWMLGQIEKELRPAIDEAGRDGEDPMLAFENLPCVQRWRRQMKTPYAELSEKEKESDRKEAREKVKVYRS